MSGYDLKEISNLFGLKIFFTFTNSVDPAEMQHYAAFHLGIHCLQKYSFRGFPLRGFQNTMGQHRRLVAYITCIL